MSCKLLFFGTAERGLSCGLWRRVRARRSGFEWHLVGAWLLLPMVAWGQPGLFVEPPAWSPTGTICTASTALGDVDGDGDLDLVCGNVGQPTMLFLNVGHVFALTPSWTSPRADSTWSVALGDVDGDGDLDLVCGNHGLTKLYRNTDGVLGPTPDWVSERVAITHSVALGDVDGDGDLDLVCGNWGQSVLYRNVGGTFASTPAWSGGQTATTARVVLGDVDRDNDLDLVCGNFGSTTLYANSGGTFGRLPAWTSSRSDDTRDLALGDVDGDGDFDLVCGNSTRSTTLYLNSGSIFEVSPSWFSGTADVTTSIALGDVDGDGDLDLVCGNSLGRVICFLSTEGTLSAEPVWLSDRFDDTRTLCLGDVDGDGDLDLVCGNFCQPALYLNSGSALDATPGGIVGPGAFTSGVALGDMDGDGDLDLFCGNEGQSAIYKYDGGVLQTTASWLSGVGQAECVALADVDSDGDLDLILGRGFSGINLYRNLGGIFNVLPDWAAFVDPRQLFMKSVALGDIDRDGDNDLVSGSERTGIGGNSRGAYRVYDNIDGTLSVTHTWQAIDLQYNANSVALGDVDGDGDLDLVCGNYNERAVRFRNAGGVLDVRPDWFSTLPYKTRGVALGDVDGDGDPDLILGNEGESTVLLLNSGGTFDASPAWTSGTAEKTTSVALGDLDGDGDLDLICGNRGQASKLYLNSGGTFESNASWVSSRADNTTSIALGDIDADGDLDLVCGNRVQGSVLYRGVIAPPFKGNPAAPTYHLPNNDAFLSRASAEKSGRNLYHVRISAVDVESDPIWIVPEWQFAGVPTWRTVDVPGAGARLGPLETSPAGRSHEFDWDTSRMPVDARPVVLRLRTTSHPRKAGATQRVAAYLKSLGPIEVSRPVIATSRVIRFPAVTVGDTVVVRVTIDNRGNELLAVQRVILPTSAIRLEGTIPFDLEPGASTELLLSLEPRSAVVDAESLWVESNDPEQPRLGIAIEAEVHALTFTARLMTALPEVSLGQALTALLTPGAGVRIERAVVRCRDSGTSGLFESYPLLPSGSEFLGTIPGAAVTEAGIEYYFEVENSGVLVTLPADGSTLRQAVLAPEAIAALPQPNSSSGFLDGGSVVVQVSIPEGSQFVRGALHFRRGGEITYGVDSLRLADPFPVATIPADVVGARGVQYWVEVQTATRALTDPGSDPVLAPHELRPTVRNLVEGTVHPDLRYRLLSLPLEFGTGFTGSLATLLADQSEFGPYDPMQWRAFRYLPGQAANVELSAADPAIFRPELGRAFWLISRQPHQVDTAPAADTRSTPADAPYEITLEPGWNSIGNPFAFPVSVADVEFPAGVESLTAFDPNRGAHGDYADRPVRVLQPFEGYFAYNAALQPAVLKVRPIEASSAEVAAAARVAIRPQGPGATPAAVTESWVLRLAARTSSAFDGSSLLGVHGQAADESDGFDLRKPPAPPGPWVRLGFPHSEWEAKSGFYRQDVRAPKADGHVWEIELTSATRGEAIEVLPQLEGPLPDGLALRLLDFEQATAMDLRHADGSLAGYSILSHGPERPVRLTLLAGTETWVADQQAQQLQLPARLALENTPNPFNATTRIRFALPQSEVVTLAVYNVRGERLATLARGEALPAGYHVRWWNGRDDAGQPVASGLYFCHLVTRSSSLTKRMALLK